MNRRLALLVAAALLAACSSGSGGGDDAGGNSGDSGVVDAGSDASPTSGDADGVDADAGPGRVSLIDQDAWQEVTAAADDPFGDRPAMVDCSTDGWGVEDLDMEPAFTVETDACHYMTAHQTTRVDLDQGDTIHLRAWHFELIGSGEAHMAIQLGDDVIWDEHIPIPSDAELAAPDITAPADAPAGTDIYFHVHNHGDNTYNLIEVSTDAE